MTDLEKLLILSTIDMTAIEKLNPGEHYGGYLVSYDSAGMGMSYCRYIAGVCRSSSTDLIAQAAVEMLNKGYTPHIFTFIRRG